MYCPAFVSALDIAISNLTSVSVLVFGLGFLAARLKGDVRIPEQVYQTISVYLLFGIGLKGGLALNESAGVELVRPVLATVGMAVVLPLLAFGVLRWVRTLTEIDRGAMAAHYGSTSLVTFTAALVYLENSGITYEGYATALLTIMEIPGIIVGIFLATRHLTREVSWGESLREILFGRTVLLLLGGLVVGAIAGDTGYERVAPFFVDLLPGILALFLLHLGYLAGSNLSVVRAAGWRLVVFGVSFPAVAGVLGVGAGAIAGMSAGGATVLGVLCASASYIAAPAAVQIAVPEADKSLPITSSLGITFPFNLIVGIPLISFVASWMGG